MDSTILTGVVIVDGAVIGAGRVVSKNEEDYEIVAGNPAQISDIDLQNANQTASAHHAAELRGIQNNR